jgi:hypothetical protein
MNFLALYKVGNQKGKDILNYRNRQLLDFKNHHKQKLTVRNKWRKYMQVITLDPLLSFIHREPQFNKKGNIQNRTTGQGN